LPPQLLEQQQRGKSARNQPLGIVLDLRRIGTIVVNPMRIEGCRGKAKHQHRIGGDVPLPRKFALVNRIGRLLLVRNRSLCAAIDE
jgi:hypothetical protein